MPKEKNILFELQIYKDAKEKELLEDDFDEEEFLNKMNWDAQNEYDRPFRSNLIATNVVSIVVSQKKKRNPIDHTIKPSKHDSDSEEEIPQRP